MPGDNDFTIAMSPGWSVYGTITNEDGDVWSGAAYVPFVLEDWADYAIPATETSSAPPVSPDLSLYFFPFPVTSPRGEYTPAFYRQRGGSPDIANDPKLTIGASNYWNGSEFKPDPPPPRQITMSATAIRLRYPTGSTLYCQIEDANGDVWNGTAFADYSLDAWSSYATAMPETPAGSGRYRGEFPTAAAVGNYSVAVYVRAGDTPASADICVGLGESYWDGTALGNVPGVPAIQATLDGYNQLLLNGAVVDPAPSATKFKGSSTFATDSNYYNGRQVCFTSGDLAGLKQPISTYVGSTRTFTVSPGFPFAPANGDSFSII